MLGEDGELVAAQPRDEVALAHRGHQPLADDDQGLIAGGVAIDVVDLLEAVEVEHEQRVHRAGTRRRRDRPLERLGKLPAVGKPGQRILKGELAHVLLGRDAAARLALLLAQPPPGEDQQARAQHGAEQRPFVRLDRVGDRRHLVGDEDVEFIEDVGAGEQRHEQKGKVLKTEAMPHEKSHKTMTSNTHVRPG
jgi:hypothetical protein